MVLGDGYIRTASSVDKLAGRRIAAQLTLGHSVKQSKYAQWKLDKLNKMFGGNATLSFRKIGGYPSCYAAKSNPYFKTLKGMMYFDGQKTITPKVLSMLNPEGIAIWFMDDGSYRMNKKLDGNVSSVSLIISTYCSEPENKSVINYFNETHGIVFKPAYCKRTEKWYVRTNTEGARNLAGLIRDYMVPSMEYKLSCVQDLDRHERLIPDKICNDCDKLFVFLRAKGLCGNCYAKQHTAKLAMKTRKCDICGKTKSAKYYRGNRCNACYSKELRLSKKFG